MTTFLLLSTADTELLAARRADERWRTANPARLEAGELAGLLTGVAAVVLRLLGGRRSWEDGVEELRASGVPLVALGGEAAPDAELMALSSVPAGVATDALALPARGRRPEPRAARGVPLRHAVPHR